MDSIIEERELTDALEQKEGQRKSRGLNKD